MIVSIAEILIGFIIMLYGAYTLGADNRLNEVNNAAYKAHEKGLELNFYKDIPENGVKFIPNK